MDYKSGAKKLETRLMEHGLQLQLAGYLAALRQLELPRDIFGVGRIVPAGMFYVNLRGRSERAATRTEALRNRASARQSAYQHFGRFDVAHLERLDNRGARDGTHFHYKLTLGGKPYATVADAMESASFEALLDDVEEQLRRMGREIYEGAIQPNPFQNGSVHACDQCECQAICRFDPWTDSYRQLK